jgi:hypothetical protein
MDLSRRRVGRPSGMVFTSEELVFGASQAKKFSDVNIPLTWKQQTLENETSSERFARNFIMAGNEKSCFFCKHMQSKTNSTTGWKSHMRSETHKKMEDLYFTSMYL